MSRKTAGSLCGLGTVFASAGPCLLTAAPPASDMVRGRKVTLLTRDGVAPHGCRELRGGVIRSDRCKQDVKRVRVLLVTTHPAEKPGALYLSNLPSERLSDCLQGATVKASRKPCHQNHEPTGNDSPTSWLLFMKRLFLFPFHPVSLVFVLY